MAVGSGSPLKSSRFAFFSKPARRLLGHRSQIGIPLDHTGGETRCPDFFPFLRWVPCPSAKKPRDSSFKASSFPLCTSSFWNETSHVWDVFLGVFVPHFFVVGGLVNQPI